jgi:hypothetical protein
MCTLPAMVNSELKDVAKGKVTQSKQRNMMHNMLMQPDCLTVVYVLSLEVKKTWRFRISLGMWTLI